MSLVELGKRAEVSVGHLSQVERGQSSLTSDKLARVAGALGVSSDALLGPAGDGVAPQATIPQALAELAEELELTYAKTIRLYTAKRSLVARRSSGTSDEFSKAEWKAFYSKVKQYL